MATRSREENMRHLLGVLLLFLFPSPFSFKNAEAFCIVDPPSYNIPSCYRFYQSKPSCSSGYKRVDGEDCACSWFGCFGSYYKCDGIPRCCDGWTGGSSCNIPICANGCNSGTCIAPNTCNCPEGYSGDSCEIAPPPSADELTVMTLNMACRDFGPFAGCDNCQTRFDLMAEAFADSSNFEGFPDLDQVDVILAQELGTSTENFAQISSALASRGFVYTTGDPAPTADDNICDDPPLFGSVSKDISSYLTGYDAGGLVTFSKYHIIGSHAQNWCAHSFPVPSGYLLTLLDVGDGRIVVVVNLHAMPEFDLGVEDSAEDVRTYQFGEMSGLAGMLSDNFLGDDIPFSVIIGGDFNEDAYGRKNGSDQPNCADITSTLTQQKFSSVNLDLQEACNSNRIGVPTWDPMSNDLTAEVSDGSKPQLLDYLIQYSSSHGGGTPENTVSILKTKAAWNGQFCEDFGLGAKFNGSVFALSDHNAITATFQLPQGATTTNIDDALTSFYNTINSWTNGNYADDAACGQEDSICWTDADCCSKEHSWSLHGQHCNGIYCERCSEVGESCGLQLEGSYCCGYHDYSSGLGTHCEVSGLQATCIPKFGPGHFCAWDEECQSRSCSWFTCD